MRLYPNTYETLNSGSSHVRPSKFDESKSRRRAAITARLSTDQLDISDLAKLAQNILKTLFELRVTVRKISNENGATIDLVTLQPKLGRIKLGDLSALLLVKGNDSISGVVTESL